MKDHVEKDLNKISTKITLLIGHKHKTDITLLIGHLRNDLEMLCVFGGDGASG